MNHGDMRCKVGKVQRLFDRGVAAADHDDFLAAVEEPVAGGASRDAKAHEVLLGRDAEPLGLGAGRNDQRVAGPHRAGIRRHRERPVGQFDLGDKVVDDFGADMFGLLEHLLHHPGTLHRIGVAGIVLDIRGDHQLSALFHAGDQHRFEHGARGIDRGGVAGGA